MSCWSSSPSGFVAQSVTKLSRERGTHVKYAGPKPSGNHMGKSSLW